MRQCPIDCSALIVGRVPQDSSLIHIYDAKAGTAEPLQSIDIHKSPVVYMAASGEMENPENQTPLTCVSVVQRGLQCSRFGR